MTIEMIKQERPEVVYCYTRRDDPRPLEVFEALEALGYRYRGASSCFSDVQYCWTLSK